MALPKDLKAEMESAQEGVESSDEAGTLRNYCLMNAYLAYQKENPEATFLEFAEETEEHLKSLDIDEKVGPAGTPIAIE